MFLKALIQAEPRTRAGAALDLQLLAFFFQDDLKWQF